jgi:UPF0716 protein FxsA
MRRPLALLPVGLALLSIAEIVVFLSVAHAIGFGWAVLLALAFTVTGLALLRREGIVGWRRFQAAAGEGRPPGADVSNSLVGLGGALLFALPGFLTSLAGLVLLLPPGRVLARRGIENFAGRRLGSAAVGDLFGPRRVKVRRGSSAVVVEEPSAPSAPVAAIEGEVVEGEVIR